MHGHTHIIVAICTNSDSTNSCDTACRGGERPLDSGLKSARAARSGLLYGSDDSLGDYNAVPGFVSVFIIAAY